MPTNPIASVYDDEEETESTLIKRLSSVGREIINDPGVQAGVAQIIAALAALAVRSVGPKSRALTRTNSDDQ